MQATGASIWVWFEPFVGPPKDATEAGWVARDPVLIHYGADSLPEWRRAEIAGGDVDISNWTLEDKREKGKWRVTRSAPGDCM